MSYLAKAGQILADLVAIPSVSSVTNKPVIDYVRRHLDKGRWSFHSFPYPDGQGVEKINFVAITPHDAELSSIELALVCHTDTVPYGADWAAAVHPEICDDHLYGRGSCDVKGFLACILASVEALDLSRISRPLAIVLTADEEVGCLGAKRLLKEGAVRPRHAVVGEPTGLRPVVAGKGYALGEIVIKGREAHSAFPQAGRSAIFDAATVIELIKGVARKVSLERDPKFDPPFTSINIGTISGGTAKNIIPGECRFLVEWRPIPDQDEGRVADLVKQELAGAKERDPGLEVLFEVTRTDAGFATASDGSLVKTLTDLSGAQPVTVAFGTEAPYLTRLGAETVVFGPGDMKTAHSSEENVPLNELEKCVTILRALISRTCV